MTFLADLFGFFMSSDRDGDMYLVCPLTGCPWETRVSGYNGDHVEPDLASLVTAARRHLYESHGFVVARAAVDRHRLNMVISEGGVVR